MKSRRQEVRLLLIMRRYDLLKEQFTARRPLTGAPAFDFLLSVLIKFQVGMFHTGRGLLPTQQKKKLATRQTRLVIPAGVSLSCHSGRMVSLLIWSQLLAEELWNIGR